MAEWGKVEIWEVNSSMKGGVSMEGGLQWEDLSEVKEDGFSEQMYDVTLL